MDMKISGSGQLSGGEYENVSISGSGKCLGNVKCKSFRASGSARCEGDITCTEGFSASGSAHIHGDISANSVRCAGSFHADRDVHARELAHFSGSCHIEGHCVSHGKIDASGAFSADLGVEAEFADICGVIKCGGLVNAEELYFKLERHSRVHSIGGSTIDIRIHKNARSFSFFGFKKSSSAGIVLDVEEGIEGDKIYLEGVRTPFVIGRNVIIGAGCEIGTVRYSDTIEIKGDAFVENREKVEA